MSDLDAGQLAEDIVNKLRTILASDAPKLAHLGVDSVTRLAKHARMIARGWEAGELTDDERDWFLAALARLAADFVRNIVLNTLLTIERAWNAVVGTLWSALRAATGLSGLPLPAIPQS